MFWVFCRCPFYDVRVTVWARHQIHQSMRKLHHGELGSVSHWYQLCNRKMFSLTFSSVCSRWCKHWGEHIVENKRTPSLPTSSYFVLWVNTEDTNIRDHDMCIDTLWFHLCNAYTFAQGIFNRCCVDGPYHIYQSLLPEVEDKYILLLSKSNLTWIQLFKLFSQVLQKTTIKTDSSAHSYVLV
jgi:hypothetical protein